ncbi:hypothetical protein F2Q70_00025327 [Brassica cretica]|uniref:Uncharacterized protein n=1 Tax=Brassica cretica TaxID=69181 RepID=A0A8S9R8B8_BRACR|nr:hypothetical protein F2Q70_00025327 [Brassica cretica]KAF3559882.1 hypothetical protein F2Q69_00011610 [Brassica cretica]
MGGLEKNYKRLFRVYDVTYPQSQRYSSSHQRRLLSAATDLSNWLLLREIT